MIKVLEPKTTLTLRFYHLMFPSNFHSAILSIEAEQSYNLLFADIIYLLHYMACTSRYPLNMHFYSASIRSVVVMVTISSKGLLRLSFKREEPFARVITLVIK